MPIFGVVATYRSNGNSSLAFTIPKLLREKMQLTEGEHFIVRLEGNKIVYEKLEDES